MDILPFSPDRELVVDSGFLGTGRHVIHALVEVDVTRARELLAASVDSDGRPLSFTAFVVASLARAVAAHPRVQAYRDWRGRLVVFHEVDVVTMVEPRPGAVAIPYIVRGANARSVRAISDEIRAVQKGPARAIGDPRLARLAPRLPRLARLAFFRFLKLDPLRFKRLSGTAIVTSVGMFGHGSGWGIGFLPLHNLGLTVGGIGQKPTARDGAVAIRDILNLTVSFDHDVVDGAPAARFVNSLVETMQSAAVLEETQPPE